MRFIDDRGSALALSLMFLVVLALVGTTATTITSTDLLIARNYKTSIQAFQVAEAGIEEARGRLRGDATVPTYAGDPAANPDPNWSAYLLTNSGWQFSDDPYYDSAFTNYVPLPASHTNTTETVNTLQPNPAPIQYWVKVRHKREYDAEQMGHTIASSHYYDGDGSTASHTSAARGNIVYYGYGDPAEPTTAKQFTTGGTSEFKPVEIIRAYGRTGRSVKIVEIEAVHPPGVPLVATVYAKNQAIFNGGGAANPAVSDGRDHCNPDFPNPNPQYPDIKPVLTTEGSTVGNGNVTYEGTPAFPVQDVSTVIDIAQLIETLKAGALTIADKTASNISSFGNENDFGVWYADANSFSPTPELQLKDISGYGILLVDGDVTFSGNFGWHGIILATGDITLKGSGGGNDIDIFGAILSEHDITISGNSSVAYDSCYINQAFKNLPLTIISWKEVF